MSDLVDVAALTERWVHGWAVCRSAQVRPLEGERAAWGVAGLAPTRERELVLADPSAELVARCQRELEPRTWLTLVTGDPWPGPVPPGLTAPETRECLMRRDLDVPGPTAPPVRGAAERQEVRVAADDGRATVSIEVDGQPAAEGTVGLDGEAAVFDRIRTSDPFRRRGLGSRVMGLLGGWATDHGARHGLLIASVEGQALYARLGWERRAAVVTHVVDDQSREAQTGLLDGVDG